MPEPTDAPEDFPETVRPIGQQIDDLVQRIGEDGTSIGQHRADLSRLERQMREAVEQLVGLVDRPAAAKLLGITPRELAGILRGGAK